MSIREVTPSGGMEIVDCMRCCHPWTSYSGRPDYDAKSMAGMWQRMGAIEEEERSKGVKEKKGWKVERRHEEGEIDDHVLTRQHLGCQSELQPC